MKKFILSAIITICLMVSCSCGRVDVEKTEDIVITTLITTTSTTTTTSRTTKTTAKTTTAITSTTTTTTEVVTEPIVTEPVTEYVEETVIEVQEPIVYQDSGTVNYYDSDITLLAMLIHHEASASYEGKLAVGSCVINRANAYGQTISQVIYAPNQFTVASYMYTYDDLDYQAAEQVLTYGSNDTRIMYFTA